MANDNKIEMIKATPPKKQESVKQISEKVLAFLTALKEIDAELFSVWYRPGPSKAEAKKNKMLFELEYLEGVIEKRWDKKFPDLGSHFTFWAGKDDDTQNAEVFFTLGLTCENKNLKNVVGVSLPHDEKLRYDKNDEKVKIIESLMRKVFETKEIKIE